VEELELIIKNNKQYLPYEEYEQMLFHLEMAQSFLYHMPIYAIRHPEKVDEVFSTLGESPVP
jgi:hypothetical protein